MSEQASGDQAAPLRCAVVTLSDTRTLDDDRSGALIVDQLMAAGHRVLIRELIPDDRDALRALIERHRDGHRIDIFLCTGGTGITPRDITPDVLAALSTKSLIGFGELFRWLSYQEIGASTIQSRAGAWLCDKIITFALPGSTGAVKLALEKILIPQLDSRTRPCNFHQLLPRIRGEERG
ncbi:MAG: molybdenum cofactor synthesis domain-containing protein [Myxococcota bacterium]|nr:molybdenum cofactor synthesis domain-containing protein [Myxococcota bacterium]